MATVADVAKKAGVSVSTAARVISGHGYAAEKTRRHVLEAAKDLGYVPNQIARSLRTRRTQMIGLLIGDLENLFYSSIARNVESVTKRCRLPPRAVQQRRRSGGRTGIPEAA